MLDKTAERQNTSTSSSKIKKKTLDLGQQHHPEQKQRHHQHHEMTQQVQSTEQLNCSYVTLGE